MIVDFATLADRHTAVLARRLLSFAVYDELSELDQLGPERALAAVLLRLDGDLTMIASTHLSDLAVKMAAYGLAARAEAGLGVPDGVRLTTILTSELALVQKKGLHGALEDVDRRLGLSRSSST